jgi:hypothetical protein
MTRRVAAAAALAVACGCSTQSAYRSSALDNVFVTAAIDSGSRFSSMRGVVHVHEVDAACRTQYLGTVELNGTAVALGLPAERASYLVFTFQGSSLLGGNTSTTSVGTLLKPRAGMRYEFAVTYRDSIYNVAVREADPRKGSSRELARRELARCNA